LSFDNDLTNIHIQQVLPFFASHVTQKLVLRNANDLFQAIIGDLPSAAVQTVVICPRKGIPATRLVFARPPQVEAIIIKCHFPSCTEHECLKDVISSIASVADNRTQIGAVGLSVHLHIGLYGAINRTDIELLTEVMYLPEVEVWEDIILDAGALYQLKYRQYLRPYINLYG
jgi:hypothetical protein